MSTDIESDCSRAVLRGILVGIVLGASLGSTALAQEEARGKIVLDIPARASAPESSKEHLTLVVRGMKKSRSGAT